MEDKGADVGNAESSAQETERCSGRSLVTLVTRLWDIATLSPFLSLLTDVTTPSQCALQHVFATSPSTRERKCKMFELFEFCCLRKLSAEVASVTAEQEGRAAASDAVSRGRKPAAPPAGSCQPTLTRSIALTFQTATET